LRGYPVRGFNSQSEDCRSGVEIFNSGPVTSIEFLGGGGKLRLGKSIRFGVPKGRAGLGDDDIV